MTLAEKISRAKADYDEVYAAGQASGGGGSSGEYGEGYTDGYVEGKADTEVRAIALVNEGLTLSDLAVAEVNSLEEIPEKVDEAYLYGTEEGYESGKKAQYDAFWDAYQENGNRNNYPYAFYNVGWTDTTYNPKYNITIYGNSYALFNGSKVTDTKVDIDISTCTQTGAMFYNSQMRTIRKLIVSPTTVFFANSFQHCANLENITFEGTIDSDISFPQSSKLSADSVQSIIDALVDLTGATAQTLTFHATVGGKLTQTQKDAISAKNWTLAY